MEGHTQEPDAGDHCSDLLHVIYSPNETTGDYEILVPHIIETSKTLLQGHFFVF